jgi:hypothetical protein
MVASLKDKLLGELKKLGIPLLRAMAKHQIVK